MPRPKGGAQRAVESLAIRDVKVLREKDARQAREGLSEVELQFQIEISGSATTSLTFAETTVYFDYPLHYAPGNRDSDLERPHFWYGVETDGVAILLCACVTAWTIDEDNGAYTGATVQIGVMAGEAADFEGYAHLTFQGYGQADETRTDTDADDIG